MTNKPYNRTFQRNLICGRLAKDPVIKFLESGKAVCNFAVIVNDEVGSDFIPCVAWEGKAKSIHNNLKKGALLMFEGKLKSSEYTDSENRKQFKLQFELSKYGILHFLDNKRVDLEGLEELPETGGES
ncbi:MAG: single-stranded DNA-binding protein [Carnobacterium alterfunditum]